MNKIHTNMKSNKMKEWMQKNIVNETGEYSGIHKESMLMHHMISMKTNYIKTQLPM